MNAQVYHIEGQERKIKKSNNMTLQPHHSLMKVSILHNNSKIFNFVRTTIYYTLAVFYNVRRKGIKRGGKGDLHE